MTQSVEELLKEIFADNPFYVLGLDYELLLRLKEREWQHLLKDIIVSYKRDVNRFLHPDANIQIPPILNGYLSRVSGACDTIDRLPSETFEAVLSTYLRLYGTILHAGSRELKKLAEELKENEKRATQSGTAQRPRYTSQRPWDGLPWIELTPLKDYKPERDTHGMPIRLDEEDAIWIMIKRGQFSRTDKRALGYLWKWDVEEAEEKWDKLHSGPGWLDYHYSQKFFDENLKYKIQPYSFDRLYTDSSRTRINSENIGKVLAINTGSWGSAGEPINCSDLIVSMYAD